MQEPTANLERPAAIAGSAMASSSTDEQLMAHFLSRPGFLLARTGQISTAIFGAISAGDTLAQAELLLLLDALGPVAQITLARAAGADKSTTAYVIDNLETRGWVRRTACADDRRRSLVALSPEGAARVTRTADDFAQLQRRLQTALDPADIAPLAALLHRLGSSAASPAPLWVPACHPAIGVLDGALSFLTRRVLQLFQAEFAAGMGPLNVTLRQFSLLFVLSKRETITQTGFARMFGLDLSTCAVIMRGLVARGLIGGAPSPQDRRERIYWITSEGEAMLGKVHPLAERSEQLVFKSELPAQKRWLVAQLRAIVKAHSPMLRFPGAIGSL